jgi:hypothetical protein
MAQYVVAVGLFVLISIDHETTQHLTDSTATTLTQLTTNNNNHHLLLQSLRSTSEES